MSTVFVILPIASADNTISDDFHSDSGLWTYYGAAYRDTTNHYVVLTQDTESQWGAIWLNQAIQSDFLLSFSFAMGGGSGADGLAVEFYAQNNYNANGVNPAGGNLGFSGLGYKLRKFSFLFV